MQLPAKYRALVLSSIMFTVLIYATWQPEKSYITDQTHNPPWQIQLEFRVALGEFGQDFVVIKDTLTNIVERFAMQDNRVHASWKMNFCCTDEDIARDLPENYRLLQSSFAFNFPLRSERADFYVSMMRSPFFKLKDFSIENKLAMGLIDLDLPIPGDTDVRLQLKDVRFNFVSTVFRGKLPIGNNS